MARHDRIWAQVSQLRADLVSDLEDLTPEQWEAPSLCAGWSIHDLLAHLVGSTMVTRLGFLKSLALARFDFDAMNERDLRRWRADTPEETLDLLRREVTRRTAPPAPIATRLVEIVVHAEDLRRPLGLVGHYPREAMCGALDNLLGTAESWGGAKERAAGVSLVATDADVRRGSGPEVRGPLLDLVMAAAGRPTSTLTGPGAAAFLP